MLEQIRSYIEALSFDEIPKNRIAELSSLADKLKAELSEKKDISLNFICTHNSRRSQFTQVWAKTISAFYGLNISCFSGGVEVTECNPRTISALLANGFVIRKTGDKNPVYDLTYDESAGPIRLFSKLHSDDSNPKNFVAIMTCDHADQNCPFIPNALFRVPLTYIDPKRSDDTVDESKTYLETSYEIASQMKYLFSLLQ